VASAPMSGTSNIAETTVNHWQRALELRRDQLHLNVSELARRAGLPRSTVNRILYDDLAHPPNAEQIRALCKPLQLQFDVTWTEALQAWYPDTLLFAEMDPDDIEVLGVARQLSKQDRRRLLRTARAWLHDDNDQ
jgi:transcriptional regulator with XRE-family HTH domain